MKKWIEIMATLIVSFVLAGSVGGCGQAAPDQGEVDTSKQDEVDEDGEGDANAEADSDKGGGGKKGGDDPDDGEGGGEGDGEN